MFKGSPLHEVAQGGYPVDVARELAQNPSQICSVDPQGQTALHYAAREGEVLIVDMLLAQSPALIDVVDRYRQTALHVAAQCGQDEVVVRLLSYKPELIDLKDIRGFTALYHAAIGSHDLVMTLLLARKASLASLGNKNEIALLSAAFNGIEEGVEAQLLNPQNPRRNKCWTSALHLASLRGHDRIVARLLSQIPGLLAETDQFSRTPLHYAAEGGHVKVIALLIALDPSLLDVRTTNGQKPFQFAALHGHVEAINEMLKHNPKLIRSVDAYKQTPLHYAAERGQLGVVSRLLAERPALAKAVDADGKTAMTHAAECGHLPVVEVLLPLVPEQVHRRDVADNTLLHYVTGSKELTEKVWAMNPEALHVANKHGDTPFVYAVAFNHPWAIDFFQWKLPLDDVTYVLMIEFKRQKDYDRILLFVQEQVEAVLVSVPKDVLGTIHQYLGFKTKRKPTKKPQSVGNVSLHV